MCSWEGLVLPFQSKRSVVMLRDSAKGYCSSSPFEGQLHRDSITSIDLCKSTDDETSSTVCSLDESISSTSSCVTFADCIVSEVFERPATTAEEKSELFYSDRDYQRFRREYFHQRDERPRAVRFAGVSNIFVYPTNAPRDALYYSDKDLQRFLDEFVSSLNEAAFM